MKSQFEKLADQAGLGVSHDGIVLTKNVNAAEAFEKFAELIVKECGNYLQSKEFIGRGDLNWDMVLNEHFNIK